MASLPGDEMTSYPCLDSLGKIEGYRIFNVVIILFESGSVLFCVFHISLGHGLIEK